MTYRVYSGPPGSERISPLEKERSLYKEFGLLDEALGWARHVNGGGRVALLIEGDDGTRLGKREIAAMLRHADDLRGTDVPRSDLYGEALLRDRGEGARGLPRS